MSTRARTSNELKISIEAAQLACPETKVETHLLSLPLFITLAEFDPADQRVRSSMSVRTKVLCDGKTRRNLVDVEGTIWWTPPQFPWKRRVRKKMADSRFAILMALLLPNKELFTNFVLLNHAWKHEEDRWTYFQCHTKPNLRVATILAWFWWLM